MIESGIFIDFENEGNNVLIRVGRNETNIVSMNKVPYAYPNNSTLIQTLACSY